MGNPGRDPLFFGVITNDVPSVSEVLCLSIGIVVLAFAGGRVHWTHSGPRDMERGLWASFSSAPVAF